MNVLSGGKLKLIQAALRLITQSRSLTSLGLRELAREAGLNPNTFYRHFKNLDEFGLQVLGYIAEDMKAGVRELRRMAESSDANSIQPRLPPSSLEAQRLYFSASRISILTRPVAFLTSSMVAFSNSATSGLSTTICRT